ncbi:MAG: cob(I)yrinic acid a,c-diamide adenosyltransferase [Clostridiales Family XIII bacterium]|jgi:ATP:cob(I)alamin adenosyltransferase|nr:cob(I)yrinic acid a,c-diamide adenosyltransferase [Clostridiales Family XIII bacterium]
MSKIYTKKGDRGETGLLGGSRVSKAALRVECYGAIDEANSAMGLAYALSDWDFVRRPIHDIQKRLFPLAAEIAGDEEGVKLLSDKIGEADVRYLEDLIDRCTLATGETFSFVTPGANPASAALHVARTVVRRAERRLVGLAGSEKVRDEPIRYVNRLSDALYALARLEVTAKGLIAEVCKSVLPDTVSIPNGSGKFAVESFGEGAFMETQSSIGLEKAEAIVAACVKKAQEIGVPMAIAVVDDGGNLVLQKRMDGALLASVDISLNKAFTAVALQAPTHEVRDMARPEADTYGIQLSNQGKIVPFGGGYPLVSHGRMIGGLGVSGGRVEEDMQVASAAL